MIFRSPFGTVDVPEVSLFDCVFQRARERGEKSALIDGLTGRAISYAQLHESVRRVAASLARRGLRKGDVLAIYSPNTVEYPVAFHAVALLGGITTTINPLYTPEEAAHQIRDSGAKYLLAAAPLFEKLSGTLGRLSLRETFVFGEAEGATPFASLLGEDAGEAPRVHISPREDLVALPYSSGTTGVAKGVMLTHHNMVANLRQIEGTNHVRSDDMLVCVLPLFHIYGMQVIMNFCLYVGASAVVLPRFELEQFLRVMQDYRVTLAHLVPPILLALAKHPAVERYDLSSLKTIFSAAAPLGVGVAEECAARLGCFIKQGYGMTEASPATHMCPHEPEKNRAGSVGLAVPDTECKVVNTLTGDELAAGEEGEICIRGPQVMKGYLNCPEATAASLDAGGWLHTGDIGYADPGGFFYIVDRAKELIKYKGFQVAPAELEALLLTHPAVLDVAVIPCPDTEAGEVPKAYVVRREEVPAEELMSFVAERVAPYKKIRRVEFIEQIPKSPSGKILRRLLVQKERQK